MAEKEKPQCTNQVHVHDAKGPPWPVSVCSCPAGLIHMHDCPVAMGLDCVHFRPLEDPVGAVTAAEYEELHARLMRDYLSRPYHHRIRSLAPAGHAWDRRRDELYAYYARVELEAEIGPSADEEDTRYEDERTRLVAQRKKREQARLERRERTREEMAQERARLGIKTAVEKAQEAVAAQGNIASSVVDDLELPGGKPPRKRRRGKGGRGEGAAPSERPAAPPKQEDGKPRRRRRRRKRRRKPGGGP